MKHALSQMMLPTTDAPGRQSLGDNLTQEVNMYKHLKVIILTAKEEDTLMCINLVIH